MIKEIVTYVATELGLTIGGNIYAGPLPTESMENAIGVVDLGGTPNFYLPDTGEFQLQFTSQAVDYISSEELINSVYRLLHGKSAIELPVVTSGESWVINVAEATSFPTYIGLNDRQLYAFTLLIIFRIQSLNA